MHSLYSCWLPITHIHKLQLAIFMSTLINTRSSNIFISGPFLHVHARDVYMFFVLSTFVGETGESEGGRGLGGRLNEFGRPEN